MIRTLRTWIIVVGVLFPASGVATAQDQWFVDDDASPDGNGTSWATAFNSLQDGLAATAGNDVIWVAAGTYKPDVGAVQTSGDRTATFEFSNGVAIYGGFVGDEDPDTFDLNTRDFATNETILAGDLSGDDGPAFASNDENSYHVVTGSGTNATASMDGFTITAGNADGPSQQDQNRGGGMYNSAGSPTLTNCTFGGNSADNRYGGGMGNSSSFPTLTNCTFGGNTGGGMRNDYSSPTLIDCTLSANSGRGMYNNNQSNPTLTNCTLNGNSDGGMYNNDRSRPTLMHCTLSGNTAYRGGGMRNDDSSSPTLTNCTFGGNLASDLGGGIFNHEYCSPTLKNCTFKGNTAGGAGGGIYGVPYSSPTLTNCTFTENRVGGNGGGMYTASSSSPTLTNCTFSGNTADGDGGGMYASFGSPTLTNCVFWGNCDGGGSDESAQIHGSSPSVAYSCIQGLDTLVGEGNIGDDPLLTRDGMHLRSDSPCIDAGDPSGFYNGQTDVDGEAREIDDQVDIGSDEFIDTDGDELPDWWEQFHFGTPTVGIANADTDNDGRDNLTEYGASSDPLKPWRTYYVDLAGNDDWDGLASSWDGEHGPKATIQSGIDIADLREGDVVVVAPGTYTGDGNRDLDFIGKTLTVRSRAPNNSEVVSATVIDCEGTDSDQHRAFAFHSGEGSDSVVAGFTITGGFSTEGGAVSCRFSSPTLVNCAFGGNTSHSPGGGGMHNYSSSPTLTHCTFSGNTASRGGGIYNHSSNPTLNNCILWGNYDSGGSNQSAQIRGGSPSVAYSCIQGLDTLGGNGNIGDDPLLTRDGIHLQANSPCIDAGDPSGDYDAPTDVDGEPRKIGDFVDMGGDEFMDTDGDELPDWWERLHFGSSTAGDANADDDDDGRDHLAEYAGDTDPWRPRRTYYVAVDGDDGWDGLAQAWDGAHGPKATVQAGIDSADPQEGDVVVVGPGTYTGVGNRDLDFLGKALTVRSRNPNDPEVVAATAINCEGADGDEHRAFWFQSGEGPFSVVAGLTITGGYATNGGAIRCFYSNPTLTNCSFTGNSAGTRGGGMYNVGSSPTLVNCTFSGNTADYSGGGVYNFFSSPTLTDCIFSGNTDSGMRNYSSSPTLTHCTLSGNTGIGMQNSNSSSPTLTYCTLSGNGGSGMSNIYSCSPTLTHCTLSGNKADNQGGGMYDSGGSPTLINCNFIRNSATDGGGMFIYDSTSTLTNCTFSGNIASDGGGMYSYASSPVVTNCTFRGNSASHKGGGVYNYNSSENVNRPTLTNCTFSGNKAIYFGRALAFESHLQQYPSTLQIADSILWNGGYEVWNGDGSTITITHSNVQAGWAGEGNISDDPMFARVPNVGGDGVWGTEDDDYGDLRLTGGSPAVDAGDPGVVLEPGVGDLDGHARVLCGRVDMGAYEFGIGSSDCDGELDVVDWGHLQACFVGKDAGGYAAGCEAFDFEYDGDVDLSDFAGFENLSGE